MSSSAPTSVPQCGCDCGSGQAPSTIACPSCRKMGVTVGSITPQHTLKKEARDRLDPGRAYHFCETPDCDSVYYNEVDTSVFTTADLINRVTLKDDSPDTRLCYCFKILKSQALEDIARTGTTDVFKTIQSKMKPGQSCFCEKSNPRGDTCVKDIRTWLEAQGISEQQNSTIEAAAKSGCCGDTAVKEKPKTGCC